MRRKEIIDWICSARLVVTTVPVLVLVITFIVNSQVTQPSAFRSAELLMDDLQIQQLTAIAHNITQVLQGSSDHHIMLTKIVHSKVTYCCSVTKDPNITTIYAWTKLFTTFSKFYNWTFVTFINYTDGTYYSYLSGQNMFLYMTPTSPNYTGGNPSGNILNMSSYPVVNNKIIRGPKTLYNAPRLSFPDYRDPNDSYSVWEEPKIFSAFDITIKAMVFATTWYYPGTNNFAGASHHALDSIFFNKIMKDLVQEDDEIFYMVDQLRQFLTWSRSNDIDMFRWNDKANKSERVMLSTHSDGLLRKCNQIMNSNSRKNHRSVRLWNFIYDEEYLLSCILMEHLNIKFEVCKVAPIRLYNRYIRESLIYVGVCTFAISTGTVIVMLMVTYLINKSMKHLVINMRTVANYSLDSFIPTGSIFSEINLINQSFECMVHQLQSYKAFLPASRLAAIESSISNVSPISPKAPLVASLIPLPSLVEPNHPNNINVHELVNRDLESSFGDIDDFKHIEDPTTDNPTKPNKILRFKIHKNRRVVNDSLEKDENSSKSTDTEDMNHSQKRPASQSSNPNEIKWHLGIGLSYHKRICVLLVNLSNFTNMVETLSNHTLCNLHSLYIDAIVTAANHTRATYDNFVGDSMLLAWNLLYSCPDPIYTTCYCSCSISDRIHEINSKMSGPKLIPCFTISSGSALYGNMGTTQLRAPVLIGRVVKTVQTLQRYCKSMNLEILLDQTCGHYINQNSQKQFFYAVLAGVTNHYDNPSAMKIYNLRHGLDNSASTVNHNAIASFQNKDFQKCYEILSQFNPNPLVLHLEDQAQKHLLLY